MSRFLIPLAAAASLLGAAPAAAQWFPQPQGHAYGYDNYGHARAIHARINNIQREIRRLADYRRISPREYRDLRSDARNLERRFIRDARDGRGLSRQEAYNIERRIMRLEWRIARDARDGRRLGYRW